jgi:hypothetical protein
MTIYEITSSEPTRRHSPEGDFVPYTCEGPRVRKAFHGATRGFPVPMGTQAQRTARSFPNGDSELAVRARLRASPPKGEGDSRATRLLGGRATSSLPKAGAQSRACRGA